MDIIDAIAAFMVALLSRILRFFPIEFVVWLGKSVGTLLFYSGIGRYTVAYRNMRAAYSTEKTPAEIRGMVRAFYENMGRTFAEILYMASVDAKYIQKYVKIENRHYFDEALKKRKGVIFLTAHYGNWELSGIVSSLEGYPLYVLAREQAMKRLNEFINKVRESKGSKVVRKGITTRYIVKALHENKIIGMLADQNAGANGIMADFFGRPASTAYGPYRIGMATGATIIPVFMVREKGPYHRLCVEAPIEVKDGDDMLPYVKKYNAILEKYIRLNPGMWLWGHRRWKLTPVKKIIVLSDGKAGHLNQSMALVKKFKQYRRAKNIDDANLHVEVIPVKFRNKFSSTLVNLSCLVPGFHSMGHLRLLKFALMPESFEKIEKTFADIVISTGFSLTGLNKIVAIENGAKNAVSMTTGYLGNKDFDMVILHGHDVKGKVKAKHVVVSDVAPNQVDAEYLKECTGKICTIIKVGERPSLGFVFGGDNDTVKYSKEAVLSMSQAVLGAAKRSHMDVLITTSRRTTKEQENVIKETFANEKLCKFLAIANEKNEPYYMGGILGVSDIIVVTGESISMVSEAVETGKHVVVYVNRGDRTGTKFEHFLDKLERNGKIKIASSADLEGAILSMKDKPHRPVNDKDDLIYMNMWRLGG